MKTGFTSAEIFRKYLWYLLRERKFDQEAVADVVQLKTSLQLSDEEVRSSYASFAFRLGHALQAANRLTSHVWLLASFASKADAELPGSLA